MLSDKQWAKLEPLLPQYSSAGGPWKYNRAILEGILWILKTGARWRDLPGDFGVSPATCWRRLRLWEEQDVWLKVWRHFLGDLDKRGQLDWSESFIDGSFSPAKKGALVSAKPSVQGHKVDGGGRRPRYSSGKPLEQRVARGSEIGGQNLAAGKCATARPRSPQEQIAPPHCRSGLRERSSVKRSASYFTKPQGYNELKSLLSGFTIIGRKRKFHR